jgi:protein-disulfide isomerase
MTKLVDLQTATQSWVYGCVLVIVAMVFPLLTAGGNTINGADSWCETAGAIVSTDESIRCQYEHAQRYSLNLQHVPKNGNDQMGIRFVAFEDFNCSACGELAETLTRLLEDYNYRFEVYFKDFPIDRRCNSHTRYTTSVNGCMAHRAAYAAQTFGYFWFYVDMLYANIGQFSRDDLLEYAEMLGMEREAFARIMDSPTANQRVVENIEEGWNLGHYRGSRVLVGTPTLFVNGVLIALDPTYANLKRIIEAIK